MNANDELPELITRAEVAHLARVNIERVRLWDKAGLLPRVRPAGTNLVLFRRDEFLAWLRGEQAGAGRR